MKNRLVSWLFLPILLLTFGCQPSVQSAEEKFCSDLDAFEASLTKLSELDSSSSVEDARTAFKDAVASLNTVSESAAEVKKAELNELNKSKDDLDKTIKNLPDQESLAEAVDTIKEKVEVVKAARAQLRSDVECAE